MYLSFPSAGGFAVDSAIGAGVGGGGGLAHGLEFPRQVLVLMARETPDSVSQQQRHNFQLFLWGRL